jgi:ABC-type arginine transport system permease subunit
VSRPVVIVLTILAWAGVILVQNISKLVPHASPEEVQPFVVPTVILALVCTALLIKTLMAHKPSP